MQDFTICTGNSRQAAKWPPSSVTFDSLCKRLEVPIKTSETVAEYRKMSRKEKAEAKDHGGFVAAEIDGLARKKEKVTSRTMITLDVDKADKDFLDNYDFLHRYKAVVYTTHSHTPDAPRYRVLIPLVRKITPDECNAISRYIASDMGIDQIDPCSFEPNQVMFWPSCSKDGVYVCKIFDGELLDPDEFLAAHPDWRDVTKLPTAPGEKKAFETQQKKQEDPLLKQGIVGDFCRTYSITDVMEGVLSDVYEPSTMEDRWHLRGSDSIAGVVVYDNKYAYSHHATDPAYGRLLNAFDLVRIHLFGDDDPKKSFNAMAEKASADEAVREKALEHRQEEAADDFSDDPPGDGGDDPPPASGKPKGKGSSWKKKLVFKDKSTKLENSLHNIKLIIENDEFLQNIVFNQLADGLEIRGDVPWEHPSKFWRDADDAQLICYVDDNYGTFSARNYEIAITKVADDRSYHPIKQMFDALPEWDGVPRVDTLLIDYLGAADNEYTRAITRKTLCAARRRILVPGFKFDYMPVLNGPQGIGKSTLIAKLGMEWYSDSLNLSDMNDKTAAEKLQGYWLMEIGELAGMKKADLDKVKAFISRQDDKYRASFGRRVTPHPRQCVFFGTTNSENGYLRDITGNRRYWNVKVDGNGKYHSWDLDQDTVNQIWAEVKVIEPDEKLFLPPGLEDYAKGEQREAMEQDDREGIVRKYLDLLLPANWDDMDLQDRRSYVNAPDDPTTPTGTIKRTEVSNMEIWCECFGKPKEDIKYSDSYAISSIMERIDDWDKADARKVLPIYGRQRYYKRL